MHLTTSTIIAAVLTATSAVSAASANAGLDKRRSLDNNLGSLLDERNIDTFFNEDSHNTPRHARPIFQSASSSHKHKHKRRSSSTSSSDHHAKRGAKGTCKKKASSSSVDNNAAATTQDAASNNDWTPTLSSSSSSAPQQPKETGKTISPITSGKDSLGGVGLFSFVDTQCGKSGATEDVTKTTGPNGAMDWLNCGLNDGSGWNPPNVKIKDILVMSLDEALEEIDSPFKACQPYLSMCV